MVTTHLRAAAVALVLLSLAWPARVAAQNDTTLIRVGAGPDDPSAPIVYAAQTGMFRKAGLNVEFEKLAGAAVVAAALAGGSLEIGKASTTGVVTAYAKGLPFTIIGAIANYTPDHRDIELLVPLDSPVKTAKDLVGLTMGSVSLQDQSTVATFAWLAQHGVDWHQLKIAELPASAALAAMDDHRIDTADVYEPYLSAFLASGHVRPIGYPYDAIAPRFAEAVLFGNANWINAHRDLADRFVRVVAEASAYVGAHEDEVRPMIAQFGGLDPAANPKMNHPARGVAIGPDDIQPVIDVLAKYGVIAKSFPAADIICSCAPRR